MAEVLSSGPLLRAQLTPKPGKPTEIVNNVMVLIIDPQNDFHSNNALAVPGAVEDSIRIQDMINQEQMRIDRIVVTLDSHHRNHIAHACFWKSDKPVHEVDNTNALR
jgi:nicotinamidase-related amidase